MSNGEEDVVLDTIVVSAALVVVDVVVGATSLFPHHSVSNDRVDHVADTVVISATLEVVVVVGVSALLPHHSVSGPLI